MSILASFDCITWVHFSYNSSFCFYSIARGIFSKHYLDLHSLSYDYPSFSIHILFLSLYLPSIWGLIDSARPSLHMDGRLSGIPPLKVYVYLNNGMCEGTGFFSWYIPCCSCLSVRVSICFLHVYLFISRQSLLFWLS